MAALRGLPAVFCFWAMAIGQASKAASCNMLTSGHWIKAGNLTAQPPSCLCERHDKPRKCVEQRKAAKRLRLMSLDPKFYQGSDDTTFHSPSSSTQVNTRSCGFCPTPAGGDYSYRPLPECGLTPWNATGFCKALRVPRRRLVLFIGDSTMVSAPTLLPR